MKKAINIAILKNKLVLAISIFIAVILISYGVIYASNFASKGELNDDGEINYADVSLLEMYLINLNELPEDKFSNADMNSDGEITVTDLTLLVKKIEKTLNYEVTMRNIKASNYYPKKNEEIKLSFNIDVSYGEEIKTITVNDREYEVTKHEIEGNLYEITVNVGETSGVKEYRFEKVTLKNEKEIAVDHLVKIDVLKQQPTIDNWTVTEDIQNLELNIAFAISDPDSAFESGSYKIFEEQENAEDDVEYIQTGTLEANNNINVKVEEGKNYKIELCMGYNLDTESLEQEGDNRGFATEERSLSLNIDYGLQVSNIKTYRYKEQLGEGTEIIEEATEQFNIGEHILLKFDSTNNTQYVPEKVVVNGKQYELTSKDNTYSALLDGFESEGTQTINIEKVILNNSKEIEVNKETQIKLIKNAPTVVRFRSNENTEEKSITMLIFIKDKDKAITNLTARVLDEEDNEITSKDLTGYLRDENLSDSEEEGLQNTYYINTEIDIGNVSLPYKYKIRLLANYCLFENDENYTYTNKMMTENIVSSTPLANINNVQISNKYPEKGENVTLTYQIETNNKDAEIRYIRVNNIRCIATKHIDEAGNITYTATLNAGERAGIVELNTTSIIFEENVSASVMNQVKIDVLKDKPTSEAFLQVDDINNRTVRLTANIVDPDKAFISGKAELVRNSDKEIVATKIFDAEHITFDIEDIELETEYTLVAKMTYDRDTNEIEEETNLNYVKDEIFRRRPIQLIPDYNLQISNLKTYNGEKETKYFERGQEVTVSFDSTNSTAFYPVYAIINGKQYELEKTEQNYKTKIPVVSTFGPKTITVEKVILDNTKQIILTENNETQAGVLKLRPTIVDFGYNENKENGSIDVAFRINDEEETITGGTIKVTNENGEVVKQEALTRSSNGISFEKGVCEEFEIEIFADYDLDTNQITTGDNEYPNQQLLKEGINISAERLIEVKDIIGISLYSKENPTAEVTSVTEEDLSELDNYIVKVKTKKMPVLYAKIRSYEITDIGSLNFILDYDNVIQYENGKKQNKLKVTYGKLENGVAKNKSIEALIEEIQANPDGEITLTQDYDVSYLKTTNTSLITSEFRGTLNGNGHTIYNLNKPLFDRLESATIQNLELENVNLMEASSKGSIASVASNTTIKNVHIKDLNIVTKANEIGGLIGTLTNGTIEECSVTNYNVSTSGHIRIAGIIGYMNGGTIRNCYVQGEMNSTQNKDGNGIGGILGHGLAAPITIENCIAKINYVWTGGGPRLNGGIIGLGIESSATLNNNVSLSTGNGIYRICGLAINGSSRNNYELEESGLISNATGELVKIVAKDNISKEFFKDSVHFDESIWDLEGVSYEHLPKLKGNKQQEDDTEAKEDEIDTSLYIPEYDRIKHTPGFNTEKLVAYHNMNKLMPYYDSKYVVLDSASIPNTHILNTKTIKHILPFAENKLITYLTSNDYEKITRIKVVFTDYTMQEYEVNFEKLIGSIAIYKIPELNLSYAFGNYILNADSEVIGKLSDYIKSLDYNTVLEPLTEAADSRLYRDNYDGVIKNMSEEIALEILQNDENSVLMLNNEVLNKKIEQELIGTEKINKMIYAYNYYQRWYGFEIGGAKVSDIILFEGNMYSDAMTFYNVVNEVFVGNLNPGGTDGFYNTCIKKYTGSSTVGYFVDYIIKNIGGYENIDDWFTEYFGSRNILAEFGVDNRPEVLYRGWYQLKKNQRMILPVITLPNNSAYIITGPAHFQIGPAQLYNKDPGTAAGRTDIINKINSHVQLAKRHFSTLADAFDYGKWNRYCIMVYDCTRAITGYKTTYLPGTNIPIGTSPVYTQGKAGSNHPFFKNFSEVFNLWQPAGSSAGVGNTAGFLWFQATPGLTNFDTWTHEFEHALYDKIMLHQRGCRVRLETLTQGNVEQRVNWSENNLVQDVGPYYFNTSFYLDKEGNATQNLTPERIDTKEKMENYYKGQQNALDLLDYIEGKAFIKLTPAQQAKIATRMSISAGWSSWGTITEQNAIDMNLTSLEALYDNRIMLRPNNAWGVSVRGLNIINGIGVNDYGFESVWVNRWFIGHLDGGYADAFSTKRNFFEMLGYAGVEGYVMYGSGASGSDLDAIRKITKMVTGTAMDWREYKISRYETVEENLENNKYIDVDFMIDKFTEALTNDANKGDRNISQRTNLRKIYYHYLKSVTNDFVADPFGTDMEVEHISTAQELIEKINNKPYGYYVLDNDIDFTGNNNIVTQTFMGKLDGNGHKIIGNTNSIFQKIRYGTVSNLDFEGTAIPKNINNIGVLAKQTQSSVIENINVTDLSINANGRNEISLIGGAVSNVIYRNCYVEQKTYQIGSVEDFSKLQEDPSGIFNITADIDFTGYTTQNNAVVTSVFTGKIEGNGHTISNLNNLSLFANFRGTVQNLNIGDFTNTSAGRGNGDFVTAFAQETFTATFKNMKFENITLSGRNNVAVVTGMDGRENANSVFENISVKNANVTGTGVYVSTFAGRKYNGKMKNIYVQGTLNVTGTENGGLVGSMQQGGTIENIIADVDITKTSNSYSNVANSVFNAPIVGNIYNTPAIKNSVAFGNMTGYDDANGNKIQPYKCVGVGESQINACLTKCYEITECIGASRVSENTAGHLNTISNQNLNEAFYRGLGFDETIWDYTKITENGYPELR